MNARISKMMSHEDKIEFSFSFLLLVVVVLSGANFWLVKPAIPAGGNLKSMELGQENLILGEMAIKANTPVNIVIPKIGVNTSIQSIGLAESWQYEMDTPSNTAEVGWYNLGVKPGELGSAVIAGHLDGLDLSPAVFFNLKELAPGDMVEIADSDGNMWQFRVVESKIYNHNVSTSDIFLSDDSKSRLNLITCSGVWVSDISSYNKRLVVFTELIATD